MTTSFLKASDVEFGIVRRVSAAPGNLKIESQRVGAVALVSSANDTLASQVQSFLDSAPGMIQQIALSGPQLVEIDGETLFTTLITAKKHDAHGALDVIDPVPFYGNVDDFREVFGNYPKLDFYSKTTNPIELIARMLGLPPELASAIAAGDGTTGSLFDRPRLHRFGGAPRAEDDGAAAALMTALAYRLGGGPAAREGLRD